MGAWARELEIVVGAWFMDRDRDGDGVFLRS
jgi:hypothetical protein